jgi:hypothetical protein
MILYMILFITKIVLYNCIILGGDLVHLGTSAPAMCGCVIGWSLP